MMVCFAADTSKDVNMTSDQPVPGLPEPLPGATGPGSATPGPTPPPLAKPTRVPVDQSAKFTRAAALWSALIVGFLLLIVLLIFIAQNTEQVPLRFLGWQWSLPAGVAILGAAVGGGMLAVAAGTVRIHQLRRTAKKNLKAALRS